MSTKGYEIPLTVPGVKEALSAFDQIAEKMREAGRVSASVRSQANAARNDPWARDQAAKDSYARLSGLGLSDDDLRVTRLEMVRAGRAAQRADRDLNPQQSDPMRTMFMRTRLKIGPWQPLVGDLVKNGLIDEGKIDSMMARIGGSAGAKAVVARLASAAVPLIIGAGVATAAVTGGVALMEGFANSQRGISSAFWTGGGSRNMGAAIGIGGFSGMTPGQTGQFANDFGDRLRGGGMGSAWMRSNGVIDLGRYTLNKFDNLTKAMDLLRKADERTAIMVARDLGMSDMLSIRDLSPGMYERLKGSAAIGSTPEARRQEAEYRAGKEIIGNWWDAGVRSAGSSIVGRLLNPLRWMPIGEAIDSGQRAYDQVRGWFGNGQSGSNSNSNKELTEAVNSLNRTMKDHAEVLGGGSRAKGTMPVGIKGQQLEATLNGHSQILGAFSV